MPRRTSRVAETQPQRRRLGEYIKSRIKELGLTREEAANNIKISQGYLSNLISGNVMLPEREILHRLSAALDIPVLELLKITGYVRQEDLAPIVHIQSQTNSYLKNIKEQIDQLDPDDKLRALKIIQDVAKSLASVHKVKPDLYNKLYQDIYKAAKDELEK
jgi:transcriptional regulator with XRE-family HTH domain